MRYYDSFTGAAIKGFAGSLKYLRGTICTIVPSHVPRAGSLPAELARGVGVWTSAIGKAIQKNGEAKVRRVKNQLAPFLTDDEIIFYLLLNLWYNFLAGSSNKI
jgi:hypothetical protein